MIKQIQSNILLLTKDKAAVEMLGSVLDENSDMVLSGICHEFSELTSYLKSMAFQTVVIDIDPDPVRILHKVGTITSLYPEMRVVVISNSFTDELILHAMNAGARHYLRKSSIEVELEKVLDQIFFNGLKKESKSGSIISIIPISGGCGATTVAVNLSNEMRIASSDEILIIDLDSYYATVALYLGISPEYGLSDILSHKDIIDEHLLRSSSYDYMKDFHILTNKPNISSSKSTMPQYNNLTSVLEVCKNAYKYTVIDTPARLDKDVVEKLVDASETVLIVLQLTVKDLKLAQSLLSSVQSLTSSEKIILLVNQFDKRSAMIGLEDCKQTLGLNRLCTIRSDSQNALNSFNISQPIAQFAPKSKIRRDFQELTSNIIDTGRLNGKDNFFGYRK